MVCRILSGWKVENKTSDCTYLTVYLLYNAHEKMSTFFLFLCCFNKALNFEPGWDASVEFLPGHWGDIPNITLFLSALHLTRDLMGISMPCGIQTQHRGGFLVSICETPQSGNPDLPATIPWRFLYITEMPTITTLRPCSNVVHYIIYMVLRVCVCVYI